MKRVKAIVKNLCELLKIEKPLIKVVDELATPTTLAGASSDGEEIAIKGSFIKKASEIELWLILSHEMRHIWQVRTKKELLNNYRQSNKACITEYNKQQAELDAWGFCFAILQVVFNVKPDLPLETETLKEIEKIKEKLIEEYFE